MYIALVLLFFWLKNLGFQLIQLSLNKYEESFKDETI